MKSKLRRPFLVGLVAIACFLTGCGPGQMFGPTLTSVPTITATPTVTHTPTSTPLPTSTPTVIPPTPTISSSSSDVGGSFATAIVIQADGEFEGIAREYKWLERHYPGYQRKSQSVMSDGDLLYDLITIVTADGAELTIYFDITSFFGK